MNKRTVRAFSLGILLTVLLIGFRGENGQTALSLTDAKEKLADEGFISITKEEYESLVSQATKETGETSPDEKEDETKQEEKPVKEEAVDKDFLLEIKSGMNTEEISVLLEQEEMIDDATAFEQYLIEHEYHTKVQIGTFELNSKMTYEEISKIITKS